MCASITLKTLRNNVPSLNNTPQHSDKKIISNNVNTSLVWLDKNTCLQDDEDVCETKRILQGIQNNAAFYSEPDDFLQSIEKDSQCTVFLVISGIEAGNTIVFPRIHNLKQIDSIFVYCLEKQIYEPLLTCRSYSKIVGICHTQDELYSTIVRTLNHADKQFVAFALFNQKQESMRNLTKDSICFLWYQLLKDILWKMPRTVDWKARMIEKCRDYYRGDEHELKYIDEFERDYQSLDAVKWYTKNTFVYKLINQALRTEDIDGLYTLRYYIEDLSLGLKNRYEQFKSIQIQIQIPDETLYRGLRLERDQILQLKRNEGSLISANGFLSASRCENVAKFYAGWDITHQTGPNLTEPVLFIINIDVNEHHVVLADITRESLMSDELEVLFDFGSIFRVNSVLEDQTQVPSKWTITLTASNDGSQILNDYILFRRDEIEEFDVKILFGELLYDMGEYQKAERYFENLLPAEDTIELRYSLGVVYSLKGEYSKALKYFQDAYHRNHEALASTISKSDDSDVIDELQNMSLQMARTTTGIANVYFQTNNFDEALKEYNDALTVYKTMLPDENIPGIGIALQNMGLIYEQRGLCDDAMNCFQQANEIFSKTLSNNHPDKAGLLLNIGNVYLLQNNKDRAVQSYINALTMLRNIYPAKHLLIAECISNIGVTYMSNNRYDDALKYFLEALDSFDDSDLSNTRITAYACINAYIAEIYEKQKNIDDAINYYKQSLVISEKVTGNNRFIIGYTDENSLEEKKENNDSLTEILSILKTLKEEYPYGYPQITSHLFKAAEIFSNERKYQDSLNCYNEILEICNKGHSIQHLCLARCLKEISLIHLAELNYSLALDYAIESYNVLQKILSSKHPDMRNILKIIVEVCNTNGETDKSSFYSEKLSLFTNAITSSGSFDSDRIRKKILYLYITQEKYQEALDLVDSTFHSEDVESENLLAHIHLKVNQFEQSIKHSTNALQLSSDDSDLMKSYTQLGHAYILQRDNKNALIYYEKALDILRHKISDDDNLADILVNIGAICSEENKYNESVLCYSEALEIKRRTDSKNDSLLVAINNRIANLFFKLENFDKALEHYLQSLEVLENSENTDDKITETCETIGILYYQQQNLNMSLKYLSKALELYEKLRVAGNDSKLENILKIVGKVYYDKQDFRSALIHYKRSLVIADNNESPNLVPLLFDISQTYLQMDNMNYGIDYLRQCIDTHETLVGDENDEDLLTYKQILSFTQLLSNANKRKRRTKYKRLFHRRHYRRRKKKRVLKIPIEYSCLLEQFCSQNQSSIN